MKFRFLSLEAINDIFFTTCKPFLLLEMCRTCDLICSEEAALAELDEAEDGKFELSQKQT